MRRLMTILHDGTIALSDGCVVESKAGVETVVALEGSVDFPALLANRGDITATRDKDGKVVGFKQGKKEIRVSPLDRTSPAKTPPPASNTPPLPRSEETV